MPLWRISLHVLFFAYAVQRALAVYMLHVAHAAPLSIALTVAQTAVGLFAAVCLLMGRFMAGAVILAAASIVAGSVVSIIVSQGSSAPMAFTQAFIAILAAAALAYFLHGERKQKELPR